MKTKPIFIGLLVIAVLVAGFLFAHNKFFKNTPQTGEIEQFLTEFNMHLKAGQVDSAYAFFDADQHNRANLALVKMLSGKTSINGKGKPLFKISLNTDKSKVEVTNPEQCTAEVPVNFSHKVMEPANSTITFNIHKTGSQLKIYKVNTFDFANDYVAFQNGVINRTVAEEDIYNPITLAAFKTAEKLKTRYDSVLWFNHVDNKTWFYVVNGNLPEEFYYQNPDKVEPIKYKMGLVNPELKEIIPAQYDLIHNINGSIDSLIEVEKDGKKGFYNLAGKIVVPVNYDQILLLTGEDNLAVLKNGNQYTYLKKDFSISDVIPDFKIADILPRIKKLTGSFTLTEKSSANVMEFNSKTSFSSLIVTPSYLAELNLLPKFVMLTNPLRKSVEDDGSDMSRSIAVKYDGEGNKEEGNWFQAVFHSVVDDYIGGRGGLYESKKLLLVDKKQNKVLTFDANSYFGEGEGGGELSGGCNENAVKMISDSLFEFKTTSILDQYNITDEEYITEGPYYHYLQIKNGKLVALPTNRLFPTQYAKLDDSYLQGCYVFTHTEKDEPVNRTADRVSDEVLQIMKNEIYASYKYAFKNKKWSEMFKNRFYFDDKTNASVEDSLTVIDRYNINWIDKRLKAKNTLAAK
jgi:hypothetical protein